MFQVEIISEMNTWELQKAINEWFSQNQDIQLIDIKYQSFGSGIEDCYECYSAMIIYKR